jgi:hypothetical protein
MNGRSRLVGILRGVVGAVLGGVVGYYLYDWMLSYGFYALILPGTLVGVGFGLLSRQKCVLCAIACGVVGLALGMFAEWRVFPFIEDDSFGFFLMHLHQLRPVTLLLIGLGGLFSFWFGMGRDEGRGREAVARPPADEHSKGAGGEP